MTHSNFDTPFELKFLAATGVFEGYASVFNVTDSTNDRIMPGAFKDSLDQFRRDGRLPPLLWQHHTTEPIGAWREMYEDSHGLFVRGDLFVNDIPLAKEVYTLLKENTVSGLSIGYRAKEFHHDQKTGVRVLTKVDLLEVSLVTFPANDQARVSSIKRFFGAGNTPSEREFESFLREAGLSRRQAKGVVSHGYKVLLSENLLSENDDQAEAIRRFNASLVQAAEEAMAGKSARKSSLAHAQETDGTDAIRRLISSIRQATEEVWVKYSPNQPRVPAGDSEGGQWTDGGGGSGSGGGGGGSSQQTLPVRRPPNSGRPSMFNEPGLGSPLSPLDFIGGGGVVRVLKPAARGIVSGVVAGRNTIRLRGYLSESRKIPRGVVETGKGSGRLTTAQSESLKRFKGKGTGFKNPEVTNLSDGSAIYSVKVPAKNIPM